MKESDFQSNVILASKPEGGGPPIITTALRYPRFIHSELMTHRVFCLGGDSRLDFDLPTAHKNGSRRIYSMTIREFVDKWQNGSKPHRTSRNKESIRRFSLKNKLKKMNIRQLNENTGEIITSNVNDCCFSGIKKVYRIESNNYSTVASADHLFFTNNGYKRLGDLEIGSDKICIYNYGKPNTWLYHDPFKKIDGRWVSTWCNQVRAEVSERQKNKDYFSGEDLQLSFHIHHLIPRHERPDLAFDINNVVAINPDTHREQHKEQGWQIGVTLISEFNDIDFITYEGEIDTYDLEIEGEFPNFFADGIVVHNSRNARSSRAVPVKNLLAEEIYVPHFLKNKPGMQATEEFSPRELEELELMWTRFAEITQQFSKLLADKGCHKQWCNRPLEWFGYIDTLVTATEYENWFALRDHEAAMPEIKYLAQTMLKSFETCDYQTLKYGQWHIPYISDEDRNDDNEPTTNRLLKLSVARCARVSYAPFDGNASYEKEFERYELLRNANPIHASPFEHQAMMTDGRNFTRSNLEYPWLQYRKVIEREIRNDKA